MLPDASVSIPLLKKAYGYTRARETRAAGLYPYFRAISSAQDTEVIMNGQRVLMFGSNSYLGLTNHPEIKAAVKAAVDKYGSGCAGSRFLNGTLDLHLQLEEELADLVGKPAVMLYSTGFQVNLGVISALVGTGDAVLADKEDHASIVDGCLLSHGQFLRFLHNDAASLDVQLAKVAGTPGKLVVVDGVFSMSGTISPLPAIVERCERAGAALMVDDAHALGVLGPDGAGTAAHFGLTDRVPLIMGTFSKSLASLGGFIAADEPVIDYLKHHSRALIFSASMSPANTAAALAALRIMRREPERIARLWENTRRMDRGLRERGFELGDSETPVLPIYCHEMMTALRMALRLQEEGLFVNPVVPPAVAPKHSLIRISVTATHTAAQIDAALDRLDRVGRECGLLDRPRAKAGVCA